MTRSPRTRDTLRLGVSTATALVGAGSLTAVGWLAGAAAHQAGTEKARLDAAHAAAVAKAVEAKARYDAAMAARRSASYRRQVIFRPRPARTVVRTRYVHAATGPVTLGGGTLTTSTSPTAPAPAPQQPATQPAPAAPPPQAAPPPPPPPPPLPAPPAPSSGS